MNTARQNLAYLRLQEFVKHLHPQELDEIIEIQGLEMPYLPTKDFKIGTITHRNRPILCNGSDIDEKGYTIVDPRISHIIYSREWKDLDQADKTAISVDVERHRGISHSLCEVYKISRFRIAKALRRKRGCIGLA